jgi:hypothetical protein
MAPSKSKPSQQQAIADVGSNDKAREILDTRSASLKLGELVDGSRPVEKRTLKRCEASDTLLHSLRVEGRPARKTWQTDFKEGSIAAVAKINVPFKLVYATLPSMQETTSEHVKLPLLTQSSSFLQTFSKDLQRSDTLDPASPSASSVPKLISSRGFATSEKPATRADRYFNLLMKAHYMREEEVRLQEEEDEQVRAEGAARVAFDKITAKEAAIAAAAAKAANPDLQLEPLSDSDSEKEEEEEPEDFGDLTAYDGQMKIDLELVVMRAPGEEEESDKESIMEEDRTPTPTSSVHSEESEHLDMSEDLEALKAELKDFEAKQEGEDESLTTNPEVPKVKVHKMPNVWDNPHPEWTLDLAGSVFFLPDAERYRLSPSLPPPPPPSLQGRRRLRLKPRLPLEISNHRYRDEHPNIWSPDPFSPDKNRRQKFENKMLTLDLYRAASDSLIRLPKQVLEKQEDRHKAEFAKLVSADLGQSRAWKSWRQKERIRLAREAQEREMAIARAAQERFEAEARLQAGIAQEKKQQRPGTADANGF